MLFEFILRPLNKVAPWGNAPDLSLSWFGLTDGDYRINVGSEHLFAYSEGIKRHFSTKDPNFRGDYVNYHVVRLWEDICEILPDVFAYLGLDGLNGCMPGGRILTMRCWTTRKQTTAQQSTGWVGENWTPFISVRAREFGFGRARKR
jgi:hypothetical protein